MAFYLTRTTIRKLPALLIHDIPKPQPVVVEGFGCRNQVGEICKKTGFSSVLLVTDSVLFSLGYHNTIAEGLTNNGIKCTVFSDVCGEPTLDMVAKGREYALMSNAECIIALGGGSILDLCKMISAWAKKPAHKVGCPKFFIPENKPLPMISIPSTSGTGAEITVAAMVKKSENGAKYSTIIIGLNVIYVVLDSELTVNAPPKVTASCGLDALSHGLEGVVGDVRVSIQDKIKSFECVRLVLENLGKVIDNAGDIEARQAMCKAAMYGGNAINKQLAGYVHAFAHSIGAKYHIPHGVAIAFCLYPVMEYQKKHCIYQLADLAHYCGIADLDMEDSVAADMLLQTVKALIDKTGILKAGIMIPKSDYPVLTEMIIMDSINYSVPVVFTNADVQKILDIINEQ